MACDTLHFDKMKINLGTEHYIPNKISPENLVNSLALEHWKDRQSFLFNQYLICHKTALALSNPWSEIATKTRGGC